MSRPPGLTPSQTVGPFLSIVLPWADGADVVPEGTPGAVTIVGRLTDGAGEPVPDGLIETWQVGGPAGFRGFGRCPTDADGGYRIRTLVPPETTGDDGVTEAPHLDVSVFARGLLDRLVTRVYFPGAAANAGDPVLSALDPQRRELLVAQRQDDGTLRFDIRLQGAAETPFFRL